MEIILKENVENLGLRGDVVKVKKGYARNYLIPLGFAVEATPGNIKQMDQQREKIEALKIREKADAEALKEQVDKIELEVIKKAGEKGVLFGSVTTQEISELMKEKGFEFDKRKIITSEPVKTIGTFEITIKIFPEVNSTIKLTVISEDEFKARKDEEQAAAEQAQEEAVETVETAEETAVAEEVKAEETVEAEEIAAEEEVVVAEEKSEEAVQEEATEEEEKAEE
ncbi:MAG: 50S ribosomal protein L9 [Acidobacteria bacterium]|nr:50S ribosomal protein L9 [Acidobacteriota bacterium]